MLVFPGSVGVVSGSVVVVVGGVNGRCVGFVFGCC